MDQAGRSAKKSRFEDQYRRLLSQVGDDPVARVKAHAEHLDEYFLRWLGFCRLETVDPEGLVDNSLFLAVEAASNVAVEDIRRLTDLNQEQARRAWNDYQNALAVLPQHRQNIKVEAEKCYETLRAFSQAVGVSAGEGGR